MARAKPPASANARTGKKKKLTAYLVAVRETREAICVYAVVAHSAEAALAFLMERTGDHGQNEVVGALSRDLSRSLGLKPGGVRRI